MKNKKNKATPKQELKERSKKAKKDKVSSHLPPASPARACAGHTARPVAVCSRTQGAPILSRSLTCSVHVRPSLQLDPSNNLTVPELLNRAAQLEASSSSAPSKASKKAAKAAVASDDEGSDDSDDDDVSMVDADLSHTSRQPIPEPTSVADLHAKLQARIASLQGKRFGTGANAGYEAGSKEELLEEARIRRGELREKRRKKTKEDKKLEKKNGGKDEGWKKKSADDVTVKPGKVSTKPDPVQTSAGGN